MGISEYSIGGFLGNDFTLSGVDLRFTWPPCFGLALPYFWGCGFVLDSKIDNGGKSNSE